MAIGDVGLGMSVDVFGDPEGGLREEGFIAGAEVEGGRGGGGGFAVEMGFHFLVGVVKEAYATICNGEIRELLVLTRSPEHLQ